MTTPESTKNDAPPMWIAAYWVLAEHGRSLHLTEIWSHIVDRGWDRSHGLTPEASLYTVLLRRSEGFDGPKATRQRHFEKLGSNLWKLSAWGSEHPPAVRQQATAASTECSQPHPSDGDAEGNVASYERVLRFTLLRALLGHPAGIVARDLKSELESQLALPATWTRPIPVSHEHKRLNDLGLRWQDMPPAELEASFKTEPYWWNRARFVRRKLCPSGERA